MTEKRSRLRGRFYFDPIIFGVGGFREKVINAFLFILEYPIQNIFVFYIYEMYNKDT